jgi:hypothetical protein
MAKANKKSAAPEVTKVPATEVPAMEVPVTETPAQTTSVEPVQLTIADLQLLARIVDLASRRGAFQAGELSQVGDAFNKLSGFLAYVESTQKTDETASETADSTEEAQAVA